MWTVFLLNAAFTPFIAVDPPADYLRDVKPILAEKCFACHGSLQQKGSLRLDTAAFMLEGGGRGPAIVPGKSDESLLLDHILERNGRRRMPPPSDGEVLNPIQVAKLKRWIDDGAKGPANETPEADPRDHWAFRTPVRSPLPKNAISKNPIDAFIADAWAKHGLKPQPTVDRRLLLRRLYVDLIGVPPTLDDQETFLRDTAPDAVEKVVDRLLQSPQYGQRWGRHWMDVWRYSDPWGLGAEIRNSQKHIWHWRDWIIESLNADKGYDQMVREMLAADELYPTDIDRLRAGGFLARQYFKFNRTTWLDETIEHTSKAFLGLTINCAKCHDHKYDPITQVDYYRLRAFFEPYQVRTEQAPGEIDLDKDGIPHGYDANHAAPTFLFVRGDESQPRKDRPLAPGLPTLLTWQPLNIQPIALPPEAQEPALRPHVLAHQLKPMQAAVDAARKVLESARVQRTAATDSKEISRLDLDVNVAQKSFAVAEAVVASFHARAAAERARIAKGADAVPLATVAARSEKATLLAKAEEALVRIDSELASAAEAKRPEIAKRRESAATAVAAALKAIETPGSAYTPFPPAARKTQESNVDTAAAKIRTFPGTSTGRRTALAQWLTDPKHPLTARVAVNQIWSRHFGKPLVATVFDFGRKGATPTHPELLDTLAIEFMENGWSMKRLHRLIATSQFYRLSSSSLDADPKIVQVDPENRYLWHREPIRLEAQALRDSLLHLAGDLDNKLGGPPVPIADELSKRRSLYFQHSHNDAQKFLSLFDDAAVRECYRRSESIVPQQALALANSKLALTMAGKINVKLAARPETTRDADFIRAAFELILAGPPTSDELAACEEALTEWRKLSAARPDAAQRARGHLIHSLLNHNDFVTVR